MVFERRRGGAKAGMVKAQVGASYTGFGPPETAPSADRRGLPPGCARRTLLERSGSPPRYALGAIGESGGLAVLQATLTDASRVLDRR